LIGILAPFGTLKLQLEIYVMFIQGIVKAYISDGTQKTIRVTKTITSLYMSMFMKPEDGNLHRPPKQ